VITLECGASVPLSPSLQIASRLRSRNHSNTCHPDRSEPTPFLRAHFL
jgi:hypothetical protein